RDRVATTPIADRRRRSPAAGEADRRRCVRRLSLRRLRRIARLEIGGDIRGRVGRQTRGDHRHDLAGRREPPHAVAPDRELARDVAGLLSGETWKEQTAGPLVTRQAGGYAGFTQSAFGDLA